MAKLIISSKNNLASRNICKVLLEKHPKLKKHIFEIPENVLSLDKYEQDFKKQGAKLIIVPSTHKSAQGTNSLSCHTTGNFHSADLGGKPEKLSIAPAIYLRKALLELKKQQEKLGLSDYQVTLEVTHHSPTIDFPVIFVEVGSSEKQWNDMKACEAAAEAIYILFHTKERSSMDRKQDVFNMEKNSKPKICAGFGGSHYAPTFTRRVFENNVAFGHIMPRYALDKGISEEMVLELMNKTTPKPDFSVIEWKGSNRNQKDILIDIFERNRIKWVKDKDLKEF